MDDVAGQVAGPEPASVPTWDEIVDQHSDRVYRLAYRLTGNRHDAEDLTQDVFVRVFRSLADFDRVQMIALPLFLCSATFFPLTAYPGWARPLVAASPLYQGVVLQRALFAGDSGPGLAVPVAYLVVMTVGLGALATVRLHARFAD